MDGPWRGALPSEWVQGHRWGLVHESDWRGRAMDGEAEAGPLRCG